MKPGASTITLYVPDGSEANVKYPSSFVTERRTSSDVRFVTVTFARGTTASVASDTTPVSVAEIICALATAAKAASTMMHRSPFFLYMPPPEMKAPDDPAHRRIVEFY